MHESRVGEYHVYDGIRNMRTMRCGQLQGELAAAALGLTRQPGAGGNRATRLTPLQQVTGVIRDAWWHSFTTAGPGPARNVLQVLQEERYRIKLRSLRI